MSDSKEISMTEDLSFSLEGNGDEEEEIAFDEEYSYATGWSDVTSGDRVDCLHERAENNRRWLCALRYLVFVVLAITALFVAMQSIRTSRRKIEEDFQTQVRHFDVRVACFLF